MRPDEERHVFILDEDDRSALGVTVSEWPYDNVQGLATAVADAWNRAADMNPGAEAILARRNHLYAEKAKRLRVLGIMKGQVADVAGRGLGDEAETFLREQGDGFSS